jgi:hypothetical protein
MKKKGALRSLGEVMINLFAVLTFIVGCSNALNYEVAGLTDEQRIGVQRALTADQLKELDDWIIRRSTINNGRSPSANATLSADDRDRRLAEAGKNIPRGVSVRQALIDQDAWLAKQKIDEARAAEQMARKLAERAARQARFSRMLSVALVSKINEVHKDEKNYVVLELSYENKTDKDIRDVEGVLKFSDMYGQSVADISRSYQGRIPAKGTVVEHDVEVVVNKSVEPLETLWETDFDRLKLAFEANVIIFSDGTLEGTIASKDKK